MTHLTDSDLLEAHFISELAPAAEQHLGRCGDCSSRMKMLGEQLRQAGDGPMSVAAGKPESFWVRQRLVINRAVTSSETVPTGDSRPVWRWTAAAALTVFLSAAVMYRNIPRALPAVSPAKTAAVQPVPAAAPAEDLFRDLREINDPWSSDSLKPFQSAVQWESWTGNPDDQGDNTL